MTRALPVPLRVLDEHDHLVPVDPAATVQALERWVPLSNKSVLIGSGGNPISPSWATRDGIIVHQATRQWAMGFSRVVSARLWSSTGQHSFVGRGQVVVEGLVEIDGREFFRFAFDPDEGGHADAFQRFMWLALTEHTKPRPPAYRPVARWPANDAG